MCGAIRMTLKCERSEHYINERWCYEQTDRRSAMIYHRICEAYICELFKKESELHSLPVSIHSLLLNFFLIH
jgi:hypothetical protein